jgi:hypothetical protein
LGEIEKGKLKNGSIALCKDCFEQYKTFESLANYNKVDSKNIDMPDFFKEIFDNHKNNKGS